MNAHSPTPWHLRPDPPQFEPIIYADDGEFVGRAYAGRYRDANARLIAAAPELLEALRGVVRVADRKTDEFDAAHAAIAKATGVA